MITLMVAKHQLIYLKGNISQGNCNLEEIMRDTSNRDGLKDNVISSFE